MALLGGEFTRNMWNITIGCLWCFQWK